MQLSLKIIGLLLIPLAWFISSDLLELASPLLLPYLLSVFSRLWDILLSETFYQDLYFSFFRWICGFGLGIVFGVFCGLIIGLSKTFRSVLEFPIEFIRSMPVTAIFPLFLIVFGIGDASKIAMAFTPTFLLILVNTSYGVTLSDQTRRKMALVFGATKFQIFNTIVIMDALPQIFVGLRLALSQSLIVTIVSEMFIGTDFGLGQRVYDSYLTNSITSLYSFLIVLGTFGYLVNKILLILEKKIVFWVAK